jgi:transcriptional regulator with XRE-family HTH domain
MNCIKQILENQGSSQRCLADKLGKSYNMFNAYVQNRKQPRVETLYDIADLNISAAQSFQKKFN